MEDKKALQPEELKDVSGGQLDPARVIRRDGAAVPPADLADPAPVRDAACRTAVAEDLSKR